MPIRPQEIDQVIQSALQTRLTRIFAPQASLDPLAARVHSAGMQRWRETMQRHAAYFWGAGGAFLTGLLATPAVASAGGGEAAAALFLLLNGLGVGLLIRGHQRTQQELTGFVHPDTMRGAPHLITLTRAEQLYCEAVAALIDAGPTLGDTVQQEILRQINGLLESQRKLDVAVQFHRAAAGSASIEALEQELAQLAGRRDTLEDAAARGMMDQSIELCTRRLQHARALEPAREQAEAQQELLLQTLASVQAGLARTASAPAVPPAAEVEDLQTSITQMNRQARAVEEAVAEVMTLKA